MKADSHTNHRKTSADMVDFGFADVAADAKDAMVGEVFSQVAPYYDRMNDVMSLGLHRLWKRMAVQLLAVRHNMQVLDVACGSGDLSEMMQPQLHQGLLVMADINADMLAHGKKRMQSATMNSSNKPNQSNITAPVQCDAQALPFANGVFHRVVCAFGLRNTTNRLQALCEMSRVLRLGGMLMIVEFSPPRGALRTIKQGYLTAGLPWIGGMLFNDAQSYRYLGESIMRFPSSESVCAMMRDAGLSQVCDNALAGGMVRIHRSWRLD